MKTETPIYKKIALDIAAKICEGTYKENDIMNGRSTLAGLYQSSPETVRRAAMLLEDLNVLKSVKGKGYVIISVEQAKSFINLNKTQGNVARQKHAVQSLLKEKAALDEKLKFSINELLDYTVRVKETNSLIPIEFDVPHDSQYIGKTIAQIQFWQNTEGTLVGVKREGKTIISPGPYLVIKEDDILLVVGNEVILDSVPKFLANRI
ncbi:MAG: TrkA C-terminal domain-containing protein [Turicibacter sp.]